MAENPAVKPNVKTNRPHYAAEFYKQDIDRAVFMGSPMADNLFTALMTLSAEVWTDRRRLYVMTKLMEKHGKVTEEMIEQYMPTPEDEKEWAKRRDHFVELMYQPFLRRKDLPYTSSPDPDPSPRS